MAHERSSILEAEIDFVLRHQDDDGWWHDFITPAGESDQWLTGYVAYCLIEASYNGAHLDRAADALLRTQKEDGGWGYNQMVPTDADSTACVLLFLSKYNPNETAVQVGLRCLLQHQLKSGGVVTYRTPDPIRKVMRLPPGASIAGWCQPHLSVTATAGRAFDAAGSEWQIHAERAWKYLRKKRNPNGLWYSYWWTLPHYATLQAVRLCVDLFGSPESDPLRPTRQKLLQEQLASGAWANTDEKKPSPFATALSLEILRLANGDDSAIARSIQWLQKNVQPDGSWRSGPIMRIPPPAISRRESRRQLHQEVPGTVNVPDQHRLFTTATCIQALINT